MIVTLDTFEIANGYDRTAQVLGEDSFTLTQDTQTETMLRGEWPVFFHSRAARTIPLRYQVAFPPCASIAAALLEARQIPLTCPRGGELIEQHGATAITFSDARVTSIEVVRRGLSNQFTFALEAINPSSGELSTLALMDSRYVANLNSITGLTGGTATDLDGQTTTDVSVGFTCFITPTIGGLVVPKHMRLVAGTTAENADPLAGPLVIRPDDYHASTNAKVWVEC